MKHEILESARMILQLWTPEQLKELFDTENETTIRNKLLISTDYDYQRMLRRHAEGYTSFNRSMMQFIMIEKSTAMAFGSCGYHNWYTEHRNAEIGYAISNEDFKKQGYMTEALETIIPYGFNVMNLNRIEAFVSPDNEPSTRLMKHFNFTEEGIARQHYLRNGVFYSSKFYSLLKEDVY